LYRLPLPAPRDVVAEEPDRPCHDVEDRVARVERGVRVLEDELDLPAHGARPPDRPRRECDPMEVDRARSRPVEAGDGAQQRRLSAAALADDAQALGPVDDEPDALNRRGACTAVLAPDVG